MKLSGRRITGAVAGLAIVASLCVGVRPAATLAVDPLPSADLLSPLPDPSSTVRPGATESPDAGGGLSPSSAPRGTGVVERSSMNPLSVTERIPVATQPSEDAGSAERVGIPELRPSTPKLADVGSWLVPALGAGVPFLVAIVVVAAQVFGGAGGVEVARRFVKRIPVTARRQHHLEA